MGLLADVLTHGIVERKSEYFDMKVDGVTGLAGVDAMPIMLLDDDLVGQTGDGGGDHALGVVRDEVRQTVADPEKRQEERWRAELEGWRGEWRGC